MGRNARREGWFPALLTRYWQISAYTDLTELFNDCSQTGTRFTVYVLVALAVAAGLHAPAAGFLSILRLGHPS